MTNGEAMVMDFEKLKFIGKVEGVDTSSVIIRVEKEELLNNLQINNIIAIRSTKTGERIIGIIIKIMKKMTNKMDDEDPNDQIIQNVVKMELIGTYLNIDGVNRNIFKRTLDTVPSINAECFLVEGDELSKFMRSLTLNQNSANSLNIGKYTISEMADAYLDGNKFFQRHAVIVGGTGTGKSWTVATILEKISRLPSVDCIVFDIHGEYKPLEELDNTVLLKVAGPNDTKDNENIIFLPYWLLTYEEISAMLLDRSDNNAPNQARILFDLIIKYKKEVLNNEGKKDVLNNFTIDSPIPFDINKVLEELEGKDQEMVPGSNNKQKQGPLHGKLTRFIQRLKSKQSDKRLNFIFSNSDELQKYYWFRTLVNKLMDFGNGKGCKIIDLSEVPSDILPLITGLIARIVFSIQQWMEEDKRHPLVLFCDEAHLYIPSKVRNSIEEMGLYNFERIAKEGRKYGLSLVIISQRPADVSTTVLSQCSNFVAMRLSNPDDQNVIKKLFPDSMGSFAELLPILDVGESLVVGDACLLPSRIRIHIPTIKPNSATINVLDEWQNTGKPKGLEQAVCNLRKQGR